MSWDFMVLILYHAENMLKRADPLLNVVEDKLKAAMAYFSKNPRI